MTNLNAITGYYEYKRGNASALDDSFVSFVTSSPVNFYPDILDRQLFMVKDVVKDVIDMFMPDMVYKNCCLIDERNNKYEQYHIPMLDTVGMQQGMEWGHYVFRNKDSDNIEILASLELVEALLRRKPTGCRIQKQVSYGELFTLQHS
jgi:hypothetical protein